MGLHLARQMIVEHGGSCGPTRCRAAARGPSFCIPVPAPVSVSPPHRSARPDPPGRRTSRLATWRIEPRPGYPRRGDRRVRRAILVGVAIALLGAGCTAPGAVDVDPAASPPIHDRALSVAVLAGHGRTGPGARPRWVARPVRGGLGRRAGRVRRLAPARGLEPDGRIDRRACRRPGSTRPRSGCRRTSTTSRRRARSCRGSPTRTDCRAESQRVFLDNRPTFDLERQTRPATTWPSGEGTCNVHGPPTRWAYFVAAPGFGPVREDGDPGLGALRGRRRHAATRARRGGDRSTG